MLPNSLAESLCAEIGPMVKWWRDLLSLFDLVLICQVLSWSLLSPLLDQGQGLLIFRQWKCCWNSRGLIWAVSLPASSRAHNAICHTPFVPVSFQTFNYLRLSSQREATEKNDSTSFSVTVTTAVITVPVGAMMIGARHHPCCCRRLLHRPHFRPWPSFGSTLSLNPHL